MKQNSRTLAHKQQQTLGFTVAANPKMSRIRTAPSQTICLWSIPFTIARKIPFSATFQRTAQKALFLIHMPLQWVPVSAHVGWLGGGKTSHTRILPHQRAKIVFISAPRRRKPGSSWPHWVTREYHSHVRHRNLCRWLGIVEELVI